MGRFSIPDDKWGHYKNKVNKILDKLCELVGSFCNLD